MSYFTLILFTSLDCSQAGRKLKGEAKALIRGSRVKSPQYPPLGEMGSGQQPRGPRYISAMADLHLHSSMTHMKVYREHRSQEPFTGGTPAFLGEPTSAEEGKPGAPPLPPPLLIGLAESLSTANPRQPSDIISSSGTKTYS